MALRAACSGIANTRSHTLKFGWRRWLVMLIEVEV